MLRWGQHIEVNRNDSKTQTLKFYPETLTDTGIHYNGNVLCTHV